MRRGPFFLPGGSRCHREDSRWGRNLVLGSVLAVLVGLAMGLGVAGGLPGFLGGQLGGIPLGLGGLVGFAHRAAVVAVLAADDVRLGQFDVGHRGQDKRRSCSQRCFTCRASGIGGRRVGLVSLIGVGGFLGAVGSDG